MLRSPHPPLTGLNGIDWDDTGSILSGSQPLFDAVDDMKPGFLSDLLIGLQDDPHLAGMCEHYDFMDKLVLHDDVQAQVRVRLHLYRPGYFDRPHNHRWSFASHILRGSYRHRIFGADDSFGEGTDPDAMTAIHERIEGAGSTYALHHTSVHSVDAQADTISLLVRGPAAKDRFLILDRGANTSFWVYGAAAETHEQRASKQMTPDQVHQTIAKVRILMGMDSPALTLEADR